MTQIIYDQQTTIILIFLILVSFLIKEGAERAYDKQQHTPASNLSKLYHIMSFFVRAGLFFVLALYIRYFDATQKIILLTTFAVIAWPLYNLTINLFRKDKWYYVGKKGIDGLIRKVFFFVNFDKK